MKTQIYAAPAVKGLISAILKLPCVVSDAATDDIFMICKQCSFECDMGKYSTRSMNKVYLLNMCCIFISHEKGTFVFSDTMSWTEWLSRVIRTTAPDDMG